MPAIGRVLETSLYVDQLFQSLLGRQPVLLDLEVDAFGTEDPDQVVRVGARVARTVLQQPLQFLANTLPGHVLAGEPFEPASAAAKRPSYAAWCRFRLLVNGESSLDAF